MNDARNPHGTGGAIGVEAANHVDRHSESYCTSERQRIETVNQPAILALRARVGQLQNEARDLEDRITRAAPPGTLASRKRKAIFRYAIATLLTVAAFIFSVLAFDPYQLGWKAWLYCLGIAVVTPFLVERILDRWACPRLVNVLATVAGIAAIVSLILLGEIRGDLLAQQVTNAPTAVIEDADNAPPAPENTFYDRTVGTLRLVMAFLAFAIEIGAGIALHEAGQWSLCTGEDAAALRRDLAEIRERMIAHGHEVWALENAGAAFEHEFWRDFYRSLLNGVKRGALQKLVIFAALSLGVLVHGETYARDRTDLVVLLDLSQSVAVKGQGGRAEFEKNLASVTTILATLPAGAKVTVIGITDDSFATPYIILSAELAGDEGYFKERLANGHAAITRAWQERSSRLVPNCSKTDILGALLVASEVFHASANGSYKVLVVLSDMRQATRALDLERPSVVQTPAAMRLVENEKLLADLHGVDVYAEGVDAAGESVSYWQSLHDFWSAYFVRAGASVARYAALRELPEFVHSCPPTAESRMR